MSYWNTRSSKSPGSPREWKPGDPVPANTPWISDWPLLASQFHSECGPYTGADGLQLRAAVLCCAIRDAQGRAIFPGFAKKPALNVRTTQRIQRDALEWFASNDVEWPYSFLNICQALQLHPRRVRELLPTLGDVTSRAGYRTPNKGLTVTRSHNPRRRSA